MYLWIPLLLIGQLHAEIIISTNEYRASGYCLYGCLRVNNANVGRHVELNSPRCRASTGVIDPGYSRCAVMVFVVLPPIVSLRN